MTTLNIAYEVADQTVAEVEKFLAEVATRDINWNGTEFKVVRDDFTCIADDDSPDACILLKDIQNIITGHAY